MTVQELIDMLATSTDMPVAVAYQPNYRTPDYDVRVDTRR